MTPPPLMPGAHRSPRCVSVSSPLALLPPPPRCEHCPPGPGFHQDSGPCCCCSLLPRRFLQQSLPGGAGFSSVAAPHLQPRTTPQHHGLCRRWLLDVLAAHLHVSLPFLPLAVSAAPARFQQRRLHAGALFQGTPWPSSRSSRVSPCPQASASELLSFAHGTLRCDRLSGCRRPFAA